MLARDPSLRRSILLDAKRDKHLWFDAPPSQWRGAKPQVLFALLAMNGNDL